MRKIYNEITLGWNDQTQRYDEVLSEDYFYYDGEMMLASNPAINLVYPHNEWEAWINLACSEGEELTTVFTFTLGGEDGGAYSDVDQYGSWVTGNPGGTPGYQGPSSWVSDNENGMGLVGHTYSYENSFYIWPEFNCTEYEAADGIAEIDVVLNSQYLHNATTGDSENTYWDDYGASHWPGLADLGWQPPEYTNWHYACKRYNDNDDHMYCHVVYLYNCALYNLGTAYLYRIAQVEVDCLDPAASNCELDCIECGQGGTETNCVSLNQCTFTLDQVTEGGVVTLDAGCTRDVEDCPNGTPGATRSTACADTSTLNCLDCADTEESECLDYSWEIDCQDGPATGCPETLSIQPHDGVYEEYNLTDNFTYTGTHMINVSPGFTLYNNGAVSSILDFNLTATDDDAGTGEAGTSIEVIGSDHGIAITNTSIETTVLEGGTAGYAMAVHDPDDLDMTLKLTHQIDLKADGLNTGNEDLCAELMLDALSTDQWASHWNNVTSTDSPYIYTYRHLLSITEGVTRNWTHVTPLLDTLCQYKNSFYGWSEAYTGYQDGTLEGPSTLSVNPGNAPVVVSSSQIIEYDDVGEFVSALYVSGDFLFSSTSLLNVVFDDIGEFGTTRSYQLYFDASSTADVETAQDDLDLAISLSSADYDSSDITVAPDVWGTAFIDPTGPIMNADNTCPSFDIAAVATDEHGDSGSSTSTFNVRCTPHIDTISDIGNAQEDANQPVSVTVFFGNDIDNCTNLSALNSSFTGTVIDEVTHSFNGWTYNSSTQSCTGDITIVPVANQNGTEAVTISVDVDHNISLPVDGSDFNQTATITHQSDVQTFNINFNPITDAPEFTAEFQTHFDGSDTTYYWNYTSPPVIELVEDFGGQNTISLTVVAATDLPFPTTLDFTWSAAADSEGNSAFVTMSGSEAVSLGADNKFSYTFVLTPSQHYYTPEGDTGTLITVTAADSGVGDEEQVYINVESVNDPPAIVLTVSTGGTASV